MTLSRFPHSLLLTDATEGERVAERSLYQTLELEWIKVEGGWCIEMNLLLLPYIFNIIVLVPIGLLTLYRHG